jgi:phospholipid transport system substrate-binding protein
MERALAAWFLLAVSPAAAGSPTEVVQLAVHEVVQVAQAEDAERRQVQIRRIANQVFDWGEMARRALAHHWTDRTAQQREEFSQLFADVLGSAYLGKLERYAGEKIVFVGEQVDGRFATVKSKIMAGESGGIPVEYRLHMVGPRWAVYDVLIDGVSFVGSYRTRFNRIIQTSSYENLVRQLKSKLARLGPSTQARGGSAEP